MSSTLRNCALTAVMFVALVPVLAGCPKKEPPPPPVVDAAPAVTATQEQPTVLVPIEDDAGAVDAGADAGKKPTGPYVNPNVARLKQCCNQLNVQAKSMGTSPEAGLFTTAAAQCSAMATQVGASGNVPELGALRTLLAGRTIPPICAGF